MRLLIALTAFLLTGQLVWAQNQTLPQANIEETLRNLVDPWVVEEVTDRNLVDKLLADNRSPAPNGLPDGKVATGSGDISEAWYSEPTTRYRHGALGDEVEAGALKIKTKRGEVYTYRLPSTEVFEDVTPRLVDLDRDGRTEVITILSSLSGGASLAIFHLNGNAFVKTAQTRFIGKANRWLNIAETGHFMANKRPEIALVVTPHLNGVLQFFRYRNGRLKRIAKAAGYSNHVNDSNVQNLSTVIDSNRDGIPELVIPSFNRNELVIVGVQNKKFGQVSRISLPARVNAPITSQTLDGEIRIFTKLDDGKTYVIRRKQNAGSGN